MKNVPSFIKCRVELIAYLNFIHMRSPLCVKIICRDLTVRKVDVLKTVVALY